MTPEIELARMLSVSQEEKLAAYYESYSVEQLEEVLRAESSSKEKISSADKISLADQWGREMARRELEKTALVGGALRAMTNNPWATRAAVGAGIGAVGGAATGAAAAGPDNRVGGALMGGLAGAGMGAAGGAYSRKAVMGLAKNTDTVGKALVNAQTGAKGNALGLSKAVGARGEYLGGQAKSLTEQASAATDAATKQKLLGQAQAAQRHADKYTSGKAVRTLDRRAAGKTPKSTPGAATAQDTAEVTQKATGSQEAFNARQAERQAKARKATTQGATPPQAAAAAGPAPAPAAAPMTAAPAPTPTATAATAPAPAAPVRPPMSMNMPPPPPAGSVGPAPRPVLSSVRPGQQFSNSHMQAMHALSQQGIPAEQAARYVAASFNAERVDFNKLTSDELELVLRDHEALEALEKQAQEEPRTLDFADAAGRLMARRGL
jgi:hypothetical protein